MSKSVLITGSSSGIGMHTAVLLAKNGYNVYATMRDLKKSSALEALAKKEAVKLNIMRLDVQKQETIETVIAEIIKREKTIDVLINNAGAGFIRTLEQASMEEINYVMDVNFYGPVRCMKAVIPFMRTQHGGHIVNVSSVGGLVGQPLNEIYCAAKFALEGLTESIATYLQPYFGIKVSIIEPGGVVTEFGNNLMNYFNKTGGVRKDAYSPLIEDYMKYRNSWTEEMKAKIFQTPADVAVSIMDCLTKDQSGLRHLTSTWAEEFTALKTALDRDGSKLQAMIRQRILSRNN